MDNTEILKLAKMITNNNNDGFQAFSGTAATLSNQSYTSADGRKLYLIFTDTDSSGLYPSSGIQSRFRVTKRVAGIATTVTPTSYYVSPTAPKTVELTLSSADKIIDSTYSASGTALTSQLVSVSYDGASFGGTLLQLSDNDVVKTLVPTFVGFGVSNRTSEANPPVPLYGSSSTDGSYVDVYFREANPPLIPSTNISGFAVSQGAIGFGITSASVVDPASSINGKIVRLRLNDRLAIDNGSNNVYVNYSSPLLNASQLKDSSAVGNTVASFSGLAVTNLTSEVTAPFIYSAFGSSGSIGSTVFVVMSELTFPLTSPSGFGVSVNGIGVTFSAIGSTVTYASIPRTRYQLALIGATYNSEALINLTYTAPTSNYIYDRSANQNRLETFTTYSVSNYLTDNISPSLVTGSSYVDSSGYYIYLTFSENRSKPLLPASGIDGFFVQVNGRVAPLKLVEALDDTNSDNQVKITLYNKIFYNDEVKITYFKEGSVAAFSTEIVAYTTGNSLRDSAGNYISSFGPVSIINNSNHTTNGLFDILDWNDSIDADPTYNFDINSNTVNLLRQIEKYPTASVIYDTEPPKGIVILNKNSTADDPGIKIHEFSVYGNVTEDSLSAYTLSDTEITNSSYAWKIYSSNLQTVLDFTFKLKRLGTISNSGDKINFEIYTNDSVSNLPDALAYSIGSVKYSELSLSYNEFNLVLSTPIELSGETYYWIVMTVDNLPTAPTGTPTFYIQTLAKTSGFFGYRSGNWFLTENLTAYTKFTSENKAASALSGTDILYDILEYPIREAVSFGGSDDLTKYEVIGNEQAIYLIKKMQKTYEDLSNPANDIYPSVTSIVIGATASSPRYYILEIQSEVNGEWHQVFENLADETTIDYLNYTFDAPQTVVAIKLTFKGDYFTIDTTADLTIAAYDRLSEVAQAQISHFSNFRDADSFVYADVNGMISFEEGETKFSDYPITNLAHVWDSVSGSTSSVIQSSTAFNSTISLASNNKIYLFSGGTVNTISNETIVENGEQITCFAEYKNRIYCGTSSGMIYTSYNGEYWTAVNAKNPLDKNSFKTIKPITTMTVLGDLLFIGTSKGSTSTSSVYTFDGLSLKKIKDFSFDKISSSAAHNFNVFFGVGNAYSSGEAEIYRYNFSEWTRTLVTTYDDVQYMAYSTTRDSIVAAFRGGSVWELPYIKNLSTSWVEIFNTYSDKIYSISDDINGEYLFFSTSNKSYLYSKTLDEFKTITTFTANESNLNLTWKMYSSFSLASSASTADIESYSNQIYTLQSENINYSDFTAELPSGSDYYNFVYEGYLLAPEDATYSFKIETTMGVKLYIDDVLNIDEYVDSPTEQTYTSSTTLAVAQNQKIKFKLVGFTNETLSVTDTLKVYWNNTSGSAGYEIIPSSAFYRTNVVQNILQLGALFYGAGSDGKLYEFEPEYYTTKTRNVYVRFIDAAGNSQGIVLPSRTTPYALLSDKITQDLNTIDNTYQSNGKIYQIERKTDNSLETKVIYTPRNRTFPVYAPDRNIKETGIYENNPFYVPTLISWTKLTVLIINKYALNLLDGSVVPGLDAGTSVKIYVKSGNTRAQCLSAAYSDAYEISYLDNDVYIPPVETLEIDLQSVAGKWFQYKYELISATKNLTPEIVSATLTYLAGTGSYYFTKVFDTNAYSSETTAPTFRRGLLTANHLENQGTITYGYTTSTDPNDIHDFNKYTVISPNSKFEISNPSETIKFGIMFTSVGTLPSIVYDFAVQLDAGTNDLKFMPSQ